MILDRSVAPPSGELFYSPFLEAKIHTEGRVPVYYINAGEQPVVKLQLKLKSGIWYESQLGESWFAAKMLMEGTKNKSAHELSEAFQLLGAFVEVEPGFDDVSISIYGLRRNFDEVLILLNEVLTTSTFPEKGVEKLKKIRLNELKINNSKSATLSSKKIRESLYGLDHPYGKSSTEEDILAINREGLVKYFQNQFIHQPEIFVAGQVDQELLKHIDTLLTFDVANVQLSDIVNQPRPVNSIEIDKPDNLQSSLKLAWHIPDKMHEDSFNLSIANTLLGGYFGSRLMKNIREEKGYTYGIHSYPVHLANASFLLISTDVKGEFANPTIEEVKKEIDALVNQETSDEEINMVVNYLSGTFYSSVTTPFKLMGKFSQIHKLGVGYEYYKNYFDALNAFNKDTLKTMIQKYMDIENMHQVVVGPLA